MATIVYQIDKKSGTKYAYSSESYWDKEKKQPRSKRTFLGKVDPVTGDIIPKKVKRPAEISNTTDSAGNISEIAALKNELKAQNELIEKLKEEIRQLSAENESARKAFQEISSIAASFIRE